MLETYPDACWRLPDWTGDFVHEWREDFATAEQRMRFVVGLSRENVRRGTGGPFGAAIFQLDGNRLVAPGVNLVTGSNNSCAHAEIVALTIAQTVAGTFDLAQSGRFELVASTAPCAMCLGAVPWSGVSRLVCGARGADAEAIGFDEGAKPGDWVASLRERGIEVQCDVERKAARAVLDEYARTGGLIYNAGRD